MIGMLHELRSWAWFLDFPELLFSVHFFAERDLHFRVYRFTVNLEFQERGFICFGFFHLLGEIFIEGVDATLSRFVAWLQNMGFHRGWVLSRVAW